MLEARVERLEVQLAASQARATATATTTATAAPRASPAPESDPFAAALALLDEPPALARADAMLALVERHAGHPRAPEALRLSAEALLRAEEWVLADWTFEKVIHDWPGSAEALRAIWGRATCARARGKADEARRFLEILAAQREGGPLSRQAQDELEKFGQERDGADERH